MKSKFIITFLFMFSLLFSCKPPIPPNNWTDQNKSEVEKQILATIEYFPYPEIQNNKEELCRETINECIRKCPKYEDYTSSYLPVIFASVAKDYLKDYIKE